MRKKLFIVLPDEKRTDYCVGYLMACGLEGKHFRVIGRKTPTLPSLSQASVFERSKLLSGLVNGAVVGSVIGFFAAALVLVFPPATLDLDWKHLFFITMLGGGVFGAIFSAVVSSQVPKDYYAPFSFYLNHGAYILLVDIPSNQIGVAQEMIGRVCPECHFGFAGK